MQLGGLSPVPGAPVVCHDLLGSDTLRLIAPRWIYAMSNGTCRQHFRAHLTGHLDHGYPMFLVPVSDGTWTLAALALETRGMVKDPWIFSLRPSPLLVLGVLPTPTSGGARPITERSKPWNCPWANVS